MLFYKKVEADLLLDSTQEEDEDKDDEKAHEDVFCRTEDIGKSMEKVGL
jgi:hypothetical protein